MARTATRRRSATPRPRRSRARGKTFPVWAWFAIGLLIGLFVAGLVWLRDNKDATPTASKPEKPVATAKAKPPEKPAPAAAKPEPKGETRSAETKVSGAKAAADKDGAMQYTFYKLLPQAEVVVSDRDLEAARGAPATEPRNGERDVSYVLQAGSFRRADQADGLKARLALIGVEAAVQTVAIDGKETWHRVRVGPFTDLRELARTRQRLRDNGVEAVVLKLSG